MLRRLLTHLCYQIIYLPLHRTDIYLRVQKPRRADYLLCPQKLMLRLIYVRGRGNEHHLVDMAFKFFKVQRPVVQRRGQAEAVIHQCLLSGTVARVHAAYLRYRNMRLINDDKVIIFKEIQQRKRRCPRRHPV